MILHDMYLNYIFNVFMVLYFKFSRNWDSILLKYGGGWIKDSIGPILMHISASLRDILYYQKAVIKF